MTTWDPDDLHAIGGAEELRLGSRRPDGTLRPYVTIWAVAVDDQLYVRTAYGRDNPWYRRALAAGAGRIQAGGIERDVRFVAAPEAPQAAIDAAYHEKYDRFGQQYVGPVVGHALTIRIDPAA